VAAALALLGVCSVAMATDSITGAVVQVRVDNNGHGIIFFSAATSVARLLASVASITAHTPSIRLPTAADRRSLCSCLPRRRAQPYRCMGPGHVTFTATMSRITGTRLDS